MRKKQAGARWSAGVEERRKKGTKKEKQRQKKVSLPICGTRGGLRPCKGREDRTGLRKEEKIGERFRRNRIRRCKCDILASLFLYSLRSEQQTT